MRVRNVASGGYREERWRTSRDFPRTRCVFLRTKVPGSRAGLTVINTLPTKSSVRLSLALDDHAVLHDEKDMLRYVNVLERIAGNGGDVGELA